MSDYSAPLAEMRFVLEAVAGIDRIAALPAHEGLLDLLEPVLAAAADFAAAELAPLNQIGDRIGAVLAGDVVTMPPGFKEAYRAYAAAGWNAVPFDPDYGGQGLPWTLAFAVGEMWQSANMAFGLCPLLNQGAVEALSRHGSVEQKQQYLEKLITGEWTGTMNLTEPQAGSDLGAIRTKAVRDGAQFRLHGQKIFITYGEHDLTPNIVHMVLARIEGAPAGVKGISLFLAPKVLPDGTRNDLKCLSLEHKLGIHASPTAVMSFGDGDGAVAWLVGEENRGLEYMFTMMNNARLSVGLQGVAIAERATQQALTYAQSRVQGRALLPGGETIYYQPDVRRMLLHMQALTAAARGITYLAASYLDLATAGFEGAQARVELLTPIVKGWCTDIGCEVASLGVQVHGGMGYIEETGAAQYYRDARILPIYEGTNGIQANDLVFRKTQRDGGVAARNFLNEIKILADKSKAWDKGALASAADALGAAVDWIATAEPISAASGAYSYLTLWGSVAGGYVLAKEAAAASDLLADNEGDAVFLQDKIHLAEYYAAIILSKAEALGEAVKMTVNSIIL